MHLLSSFFLELQLHECLILGIVPHVTESLFFFFPWIFFFLSDFSLNYFWYFFQVSWLHHLPSTNWHSRWLSFIVLIATSWFLGSISYDFFFSLLWYIVLLLYKISEFVYWLLQLLYCTSSETYDVFLKNIYFSSSR